MVQAVLGLEVTPFSVFLTLDLAVLVLHQPHQRAEVLAVARPQEAAVVAALEPVDVREDRLGRRPADDLEPVRGVVGLGVRHERTHRHRVVAEHALEAVAVGVVFVWELIALVTGDTSDPVSAGKAGCSNSFTGNSRQTGALWR